MNTGSLMNFLGWGILTFMWFEINRMFFYAIAQAIIEHNEHVRQNAIEEYKELLINDESEDENEDE